MTYFVVPFSGPFGYIKPWTAVRDELTYSQQFLTPSIVEGIEKKLFPGLLDQPGIHHIKRHRLQYHGLTLQQERTWAKGGFKVEKNKVTFKTNLGILTRGVMLNPRLFLAFEEAELAHLAASQHICLCRNEDLLHPGEVLAMSEAEFGELPGFELLFREPGKGFKVGHNRFSSAADMFGELVIVGDPLSPER